MATRMLRRGLPRVPGGEPWPPADAAPPDAGAPDAASRLDTSGADTPDVGPFPAKEPTSGVSSPGLSHGETAATVAASSPSAAPSGVASSDRAGSGVVAGSDAAAEPRAAAEPATASDAGSVGGGIRRGLPRVPGGEPWPPAGIAARTSGADTPHVGPDAAPHPTSGVSAPEVSAAAAGSDTVTASDTATASASVPAGAASASPVTSAPAASTSPASAPAPGTPGIRRGLPRVPGGEPWPPAGVTPHVAHPAPVAEDAASTETATAESAPGTVVPVRDVSSPLSWTRTVWHGVAPRHVTAAPASDRRRPTWTQAIAALFAAAGLGVLAGAAVAFVRTLLSLPFMQDFLAAFPGEYAPAIAVEPGFAPWIGWQHFFNMFLMVLIIRSGLTIRREKRPTAFWTPRNNPKGKVSLTIWFHQALDVLWLVNGVIFVVLLFATGHWVRIVPTSWEVFPNALSAALQYVSFDWPHENGWNNYNSLQQLAYFATVFLAAPLAAVTGFRMSGLWPKNAEKLSKAYPIEWARAVHFPVMLYFVLFIITHVALVFLTGFLANLNHMFASSDAVTWTGFWVFVASVVVIAIGWVAARPLVIAPIAKLFGTVSGR